MGMMVWPVLGVPVRFRAGHGLWFALQLLQRLESENTRLEAALQWRRRELVFWQWMVRPAPLPSRSLDHSSPGWGGQLCSSQRGRREVTYTPASQLALGPGLP